MEHGRGLLGTMEFLELVRRAHRAPLLRRELDEKYVPAGYASDEVWSALTSLRRAQAYHNPFVAYTERGVKSEWYTIPASLAAAVDRIGSLTQRGSKLDSIVGERNDTHFVTQAYIEEMLANLRYDGYPGDYEGVRAVLLGEREPVGVAQTVARNFHAIMVGFGNPGSMTATPAATASGLEIDPPTMRMLYRRLIEGVPADATPLVETCFPVDSYVGLSQESSRPSLDYLLETEAQLAAGTLTEPTLHCIVLSLLVNCFFWRYSPFPQFNNFMGCIVSRLFLYNAGHPVFRYLPKASIYAAWQSGALRNEVPYSFEEAVEDHGDSADYTALYDSLMRLMLRSVEELQQAMCARKQADDDVLSAIGRVPYLNHRQVEVLRQAVLEPAAAFRIAAHQKKYGVAYSTARADFLKLAELGLLSQGLQGSAYVYYASPQIRSALAGYGK